MNKKEKVLEILLKECEFEKDDLSLDSKLDEIGINSIGFIRILIDVEMEFDIEFDDEELYIGIYETVGHLINFIVEKVNE